MKPYLKKQRSFNKSTMSSGSSSNGGSLRRGFSFTTALDEVFREIDIMKQLSNPNIIRIFEVIDDPDSDKLYVIMPVADYGDCIEWDKKEFIFHPNHKLQAKNINKRYKQRAKEAALFYDEDTIRRMSKALINALDYLHNTLNIVHRDIKP